MSVDLNPQAQQMADESMVRNLSAQAEAIWPQEVPLLSRYRLPDTARILDAGCGTGEFALRILPLWPRATLLGVDIIDSHLDLARRRAADAALGARARFEHRSIFDLGLPDASFDLTVCRHVLQAVPHADRVMAELARVTRPGGRLHLIVEDYGMLHFPSEPVDEFWQAAPRQFAAATATDLHIGRHAVPILRRLGLADVTIDYIVVDTERAPRAALSAIFTAWRDGYVDAMAQHTRFSRERSIELYDQMIAALGDEDRYVVWQVPVVSARIP